MCQFPKTYLLQSYCQPVATVIVISFGYTLDKGTNEMDGCLLYAINIAHISENVQRMVRNLVNSI